MHGNLCHTQPAIEEAFIEYYKHILGTSKAVKKVNVGTVRKGKLITKEQAQEMIKGVSEKEIKDALNSIPDNKAPGPDGYSSKFFKDAYTIVGEDLVAAVKEFFNSGCLLKQVNCTTLTLIPKKNRPSNVADFRPIACCNVLYKIISKVLCARLAAVLPSIVSETQSAFIKGREIVDNILICHDLVRLYKRKACSPRCLMKVDLKKAYDSIEWEFIEQMLNALNFPQKMVKWIMVCVSSPWFSLSINGSVFGYFEGRRGIRQGDPMSPLLFTLCMEYLSRILDDVLARVAFKYHPLCRALKLSHLCFADDLLMFCRGDRNSIVAMLRAFATFSCASGLEMNSEKSDIYFNGMNRGDIEYIFNISGFTVGSFPFRYLGIPISSKRMAVGDCTRLVEKVMARIRGWGARKLSYAGRLVIVKAVLTQLHSFWSRIFIIPVTVMDRIEAMCRNYLWSGSEEHLKSPTVAWENICREKKEGGLGVVNARMWNIAMIGKYIWWLASKADHLWIRWVDHVYMKGRAWDEYQPSTNSSWTWRKICQVKETMKPGYNNGEWCMDGGKYSVAAGYKWLQGQQTKVFWFPVVWNRSVIPKHAFIGWLKVQGRLLTKDRLRRFGIITNIQCDMCLNGDEDHKHLFYECEVSSRCWALLKAWLAIPIPNTELKWCVNWRCPSLMKKHIVFTAIVALWYHIWNARNVCRLEAKVMRPELIIRRVKDDVRLRCRERKWALKLQQLPWEPSYD